MEEEDAELGEARWQSPPRSEEPDPAAGADPPERRGSLHLNDCAPAVARRDGATSGHNETLV